MRRSGESPLTLFPGDVTEKESLSQSPIAAPFVSRVEVVEAVTGPSMSKVCKCGQIRHSAIFQKHVILDNVISQLSEDRFFN